MFVFLSRVFKAAHLKADSAVIMLVRMAAAAGIAAHAPRTKKARWSAGARTGGPPLSQIYVHRMLTRTGIRMTAANWKRTTLGGLIMAFKVNTRDKIRDPSMARARGLANLCW